MAVKLKDGEVHYSGTDETPNEVAQKLSDALNRGSQLSYDIAREGSNSPAILTPGGFVTISYGGSSHIVIDVSRVNENVIQTIKNELSNGSPHGAEFHYNQREEKDGDHVAKLLDSDRINLELNSGELIEGDLMFIVDLEGGSPEISMTAKSDGGRNLEGVETAVVMDKILKSIRENQQG